MFSVTAFFVKPWKKEIGLDKLLILLFIDALTFRIGFFINFYKVFALLRSPFIFYDLLKNRKLRLLVLIILFPLLPFLFALYNIIKGDITIFHSDILTNSAYYAAISNFINFLSIGVFSFELYRALKNKGTIRIEVLNIISLLIVSGIFFELLTYFDLYYFFTGGRPLPLTDTYIRPRGFSFEPRGAVQCLSILLGAQLLLNNKKSFYLLTPLIVVGSLFPVSASGYAVGIFVLVFCTIYFIFSRNYKGMWRTSYAVLICFISFTFSPRAEYTQVHLRDRSFVVSRNKSSNNEKNYLLDVANHLEVSDGAYVNFLDKHPKFWITGTGIMSVNATRSWVLEKDMLLAKEYVGNPFLGSLFLQSMFGIFSLFFLFAVLKRLFSQTWIQGQDVFINLLMVLGAMTYFYVLPFVLVVCFEFFENRRYSQFISLFKKK